MTKEGRQIAVRRSPASIPNLSLSQKQQSRQRLTLSTTKKISVQAFQTKPAEPQCLTDRGEQQGVVDVTFSSTVTAKKFNNFMTQREGIRAPKAATLQ